VVSRVLGALRTRLIAQLGLKPSHEWAFCWIVDPPCFDPDEESGGWTPNHHPFTAPTADTVQYLVPGGPDLGQVVSQGYDIVLNGWELGSGSIRIHDQDVQSRVFGVLGLSEDEAQEKFSFLLRALKMGAPPHGGIAVGLERIVAMLAHESSIREVVAFPRMQNTHDPMTDSPSPVADQQLRELHIKVNAPAKA
jgi:aspartyl-tRNA synthetase